MVQLWQPQAAWVVGTEQTAIIDLVGPAPDPADKKACLADEFAPLELAAALNATPRHAVGRIAAARLLHTSLKATGDRLRAGVLEPYRVWLITDTLTSLGDDPAGVAAARQVEAQVLSGAAGMTGASRAEPSATAAVRSTRTGARGCSRRTGRPAGSGSTSAARTAWSASTPTCPRSKPSP